MTYPARLPDFPDKCQPWSKPRSAAI